jgi:hypothetical protein
VSWLVRVRARVNISGRQATAKARTKAKYGDSSPFDYAQGQNDEQFIVPLIVL